MTSETKRTSSSKQWRSYAANVLLFIVIVTAVRTWQHRDMVSGPAPALHGVTISGLPFVLPAHPDKPVLVHFWATWCSVCRAEQGSIDAVAHDNPNVITIAMQSGKPDEVARYMREQKIALPVVNDPDGSIARAWGVHAVPASFIVAPGGEIRFIEVGYTTELGIRLRLWLAGVVY